MDRKQIEARSRFWRRWVHYYTVISADLYVDGNGWEPALDMAIKAATIMRTYWEQL